MRRWLAAVMTAGALGVAAGALGGQAQSGFSDGAFVRGPDGAGYIVAAGTRYPIAWTEGDDATLGTLAPGAPVGAVHDALARLPAPATAPDDQRARIQPVLPRTLLDASGQGDAQTDRFQAEGRVQICWQVGGQMPSPAFKPRLSFLVKPANGGIFEAMFGGYEQDGCTFANIRPGNYYLDVNAMSYVEWRLVVKPA